MIRRWLANIRVVATGVVIVLVVLVFTGVLAGVIETYQPLWRLKGS